MGRVLYGNAQFDVSDRELAYLDAVIAEACKINRSFQFHFVVGDQVVSLTLGQGCEALLEYANANHGIEWGFVAAAMKDIEQRGMISVGIFSAV